MRRWIGYIVLAVLMSVCAVPELPAQDTSRQQEMRDRLEREIAIIDSQLAENASRSSSMLSSLSLIRRKIENRQKLLNESERKVRQLSDRIYSTQREINRLQSREDTLSDHYSRLVRSAYKNRDARIWYMYMLASRDLGQAFRRYGYFRNLSSQMNDEAEKIRQVRQQLETEKKALATLKHEAEELRKERAGELAKLRKEEAEADAVVKQLNRNKTQYQKQLAAKKKQVDALNREIERLVAEAMKGKTGSGPSAKMQVDMKLDAEFSKNKGKLPWPVDGPVVDRFGQRYHPVYKNLKLPPNNGIDIAVAKDARVQAVFDGEVKQIVVMPGYNKCVLVRHGNYFSFYCKLKSTSVKAGDKVKTGQTIGVVDTINGETQLHFQIWKGNTPQNPEHWIR